ncbi:MAG: dienelactone hydrolase family protein [Planctomycetes bacterium]|nr:dienelactone hydrolase family protein [Planctomycetota bacterium]
MQRVFRRIVLSALLALAPSAAADEASDLRRRIADACVEFARWCEKRDLSEEGRALVEEALGLVPDHAGAKALAPELAGDSAAGESAREAYERQRQAFERRVAPAYLKLFAAPHAPSEQATHDAYLLRAFACDRRAAGRVLESEWRKAASASDWARAHRILSGAEKVESDPKRAAALRTAELRLAETEPVLRKASTHEMEYYVALPKGWTPDRSWPILVTVEGAGCNWLGNCQAFLSRRGDRPYILVTPWTLWNTNELTPAKYHYSQEILDHYSTQGNRREFDEAGLLAVLDDVRREFKGEEKFFITGFSGGGNLTWRMVFGHPEKLAAAAPACGNFYDPGAISSAPEREALPVLALQGEADEYLSALTAQWERAKSIADANGFGNVTRKMLPGVGHSTSADEVLAFFDGVRK